MILKLLNKKLLFVLFFTLCFLFAIYLVTYALKQNINLFYTPSQLCSEKINYTKSIKVGGFVKKNSIRMDDSLNVFFDITDYKSSVPVEYNGILPDLFEEDKGVVVIGILNKNDKLIAKQVLAKHDENYVSSDIISLES